MKRLLLIGLSLLTFPLHAQLACNAVDFVRAPEIATYLAGGESLVGAMLRQTDGSFALQQYETFSPYRKRDAVPQFDNRFYTCLPASLKPKVPLTATPQLGQQRLGIASSYYELVDFNGQGQLAVVGIYDRIARDSVTVGLANPDLTLRTTASYSVAKEPVGFITADLNGDRLRDIAVIAYGADRTGTISALLGNVDGTFRPAAAVPLGAAPYGLTAGDFNGDSRIDLAVVSYTAQAVLIALGNGDGTFRTPSKVAFGGYGYTLMAADTNGDNRLDLIVPAASNTAKSIYTLLGNGDGTFRAPVLSPTGTDAHGAAAGDFNKDGRVDVAITASISGVVTILLGDGSGKFTVSARYNGGYSPNSLLVTDFNLDGNPDVIVGTGEPDALTHKDNSGTIMVLFGRGNGLFQGAPVYVVGNSPGAPAIGDFNGDGSPDLAISTGFDSGLAIALGRGDGSFLEPTVTKVTGPQSTRLASLVALDLNGDGRPDLAAAANTGVFLLNGNGNGTFQNPTVIATNDQLNWLAAGDLNGDGRTDLVVTSSGSNPTPNSGSVAVLIASAGGGFQAPVRIGSVTDPRQAVIVDTNADRRPDIVVVDAGQFSGPEFGGLVVFNGNGNGTFQSRVSIPAGRGPTNVRAGDLNGDGRTDLVVSTREGEFGFRYGILMAQVSGFENIRMASTDFGPADIAIADFTGDRIPDLAIAHCCGDTVLEVLAGNGDGTFAPPGTFSMESQWLLSGDLNRDGRDDLIVTTSEGVVTVLVNANRNGGALSAVSAATIKAGPVAANSLVSAFGANLASGIKGAESLPLPTDLEGTTVVVRDSRGGERQAPISFVSPGQVNFIVPAGTATGTATLTISWQNNVSAGRMEVATVTPGIFQLNSSGLAAATILRVNAAGDRSAESVFTVTSEGTVVASPISFGPEGDRLFLTIFGTGFRAAGVRATSLKVGGIDTPALFIGAQPDFPGLDQINIELPRALAGRGSVDLELTVSGVRANTVNLTFQ